MIVLNWQKLIAVCLVALVTAGSLSACGSGGSEGNLAIYCARLDSGTAKSSNPTPEDLAALVQVAPPEIKKNVEALYNRSQDFEALLAQDPPDLEALFQTKFDPDATVERRAFDAYAEEKCSITILRTPLTKWNAYLSRHHKNASWASNVGVQFDRQGEKIAVATLVFGSEPQQEDHIFDSCYAVSDFLVSVGETDAVIQVVVDTSIVAKSQNPKSECVRVD